MIIGLTGATGFIGKYLLRLYSAEHKFVCATSRTDFSGLYQNGNIEYYHSDYSRKSFTEIFKDCDALISLGAVRSTPEKEESICNYFENVASTENLILAGAELGITNMVSVSSRSVYSEKCKCPYNEEVTFPVNLYGVSKLYCDNLCEYYNAKLNLNIKSLRLSQVIGAGERGGYILAVFLEKCQKGEPLSVYGQGRLSRDYIYVKDVAAGIICALEHPEKKGIFNLGSGVKTSNRELAEIYCEVFENKAGYTLLTDKQEFGSDTMLDMTKTTEQLGFAPKYTVKEAVYDMKRELAIKS